MDTFNAIKYIYLILKSSKVDSYRSRIICLISLVLISSLVEFISIFLVQPTYRVLIDNFSLNSALSIPKNLIDFSIYNELEQKLIALSIFLFVFCFSNVLRTLLMWQACRQSGEISAGIFSASYSQLLARDYGDLSSANLSKYSSIYRTNNTYFVAVFKNIILFSGYLLSTVLILILLAYINTNVTMLSSIFLITPYIILSRIIKPKLKRISSQIGNLNEDISRYTQEAFSSLKTIKHFHAEGYYSSYFESRERKLRERIATGEFLEQYPRFALEALGVILITLLFILSIKINSLNIQVTFIITFVFASQRLLPTLQQLYRIWAYISTYKYSIIGLYDSIKEEKEFSNKDLDRRDPQGIIKIKNSSKSIVLKNVSFAYSSNSNADDINYIINNTNLKIDIPNTISITGASGCGKTTLVDLISGLLKPSHGTIELPSYLENGSSIGYVPQEVPIINGNIIDNLTLGNTNLDINSDFVWNCLRLAELEDYVQSLPFKLDSILGEQAINMSGGQKQRLGIARALIVKPNILILDESTNALDTDKENRLIDKLLIELNQSLILIITHNKTIAAKCRSNINIDSQGNVIFNNIIAN
ncbi:MULTISPECIES: ATP-binding cassette domain-containing protein [unclassified Prochlorococcus]|uniref:ATP-binding cassette domain-containing protein n=1 Tax=unclassified Prochlorococcus TaxID=2627481 RepID=UPI00053376E1|nr:MULTISPECIES: ATP-binding cassette domain-containing protein [unclassified Prochlorococcus]KGG16346.1 ABC transporter [Prochlorococcus sp. MIT 0603]KGG17920.1 ABC transporter [Prochlorococcus sp. MIT 0602]